MRAIDKGKPVRILVARAGETRKRWRKADPYLLHFDGGCYRLLARESEKGTLEVWRLESIESARITAGAFQMPLGLDLRALLAECLREAMNGGFNVKVRFGKGVAIYSVVAFMEEAFGEVQRMGKSCRDVVVRISDIWDFRRSLMSFGPEAELVSPAGLREAFPQDLETTLKKYRKGRLEGDAGDSALSMEGPNMRLKKEIIKRISDKVVKRLVRRELISEDSNEEVLRTRIAHVIEADLMVEDRLNDEVKEILRDFQDEMDKDNVDYSRMFTMVKTKLARERNLVL